MKILLTLCITLYMYAGCRNTEDLHIKKLTAKQYAGSTPGNYYIKSALGIPLTDSIDFMRWHLTLDDNDASSFLLKIQYGLSKPNTTDFADGAKSLTIQGKYIMRYCRTEAIRAEVCCLISKDFNEDTLSLIHIDNNLMHVLRQDEKLMPGNGGWSYTLTRINPVPDPKSQLTTFVPVEKVLSNKSNLLIFEGRTPCNTISSEYNFNTHPDCFKLKWKLTLNRNPVTLEPEIYKLERTDIRDSGYKTGKWTVYCFSDSAVVFQLDPDKPDISISFLAGDENVLFFLDKDYKLLWGNSEYSYTLNRRNPV